MNLYMDVNSYTTKLVKQDDAISIIAHDKHGDQIELVFEAGDAYDMATLINELFNEYMDSKDARKF